jgi:hypothetical protein
MTAQTGDASDEGIVDNVHVVYLGGPLQGKGELVSRSKVDSLLRTESLRVEDGVCYKLLRKDGDFYYYQAHVKFDFGETRGPFGEAEGHDWSCRCHCLHDWYVLEDSSTPQYVVYYGRTYRLSHPEGIRLHYQRCQGSVEEVPVKFHLPPKDSAAAVREEKRLQYMRLESSALAAALAEARETERARQWAQLDQEARLRPCFDELRQEASAAVSSILNYVVHPSAWEEAITTTYYNDGDSREDIPFVHTAILGVTLAWYGPGRGLFADSVPVKTLADFGRVLQRRPK